MSITAYSQVRTGNSVRVTVVSDLSGTIFYHWYEHGAYLGVTAAAQRSFTLEVGDQLRIEVLDTTDPDFDPIANAPAGYSARVSLWWVRSESTDAARYRVEINRASAGWSAVGQMIPEREDEWSFSFLTARLDDLTVYEFRVVPVDEAGNDGTPISVPVILVSHVRTPDAPKFTATYNPVDQKVTIAAG